MSRQGRVGAWFHRAIASRRRWPLVYVTVAPMLVLSTATRDANLIFPEAAAIAFGVLALRLPGWSRSPLKLALVPPTFAAVGVVIANAGLSRPVGVILAISLAVLGLQLVASRLAPSVSAGVFPVVFDVRSWMFPLTVLGLCGLLAVISGLERSRARSADGYTAEAKAAEGRLPAAVMTVVWAVAVLWVLVAWPVLGLAAAAVAPPMIVATIEQTLSDTSALAGLRHWAVLVFAAAEGALAMGHVPTAWGSGLLAVAAVLLTFALAGGLYPPALAIALIPQVLGTAVDPGKFVANIAVGAAVLFTGAALPSRAREYASVRLRQAGGGWSPYARVRGRWAALRVPAVANPFVPMARQPAWQSAERDDPDDLSASAP